MHYEVGMILLYAWRSDNAVYLMRLMATPRKIFIMISWLVIELVFISKVNCWVVVDQVTRRKQSNNSISMGSFGKSPKTNPCIAGCSCVMWETLQNCVRLRPYCFWIWDVASLNTDFCTKELDVLKFYSFTEKLNNFYIHVPMFVFVLFAP